MQHPQRTTTMPDMIGELADDCKLIDSRNKAVLLVEDDLHLEQAMKMKKTIVMMMMIVACH